jgi:hypothetical protein
MKKMEPEMIPGVPAKAMPRTLRLAIASPAWIYHRSERGSPGTPIGNSLPRNRNAIK